MSEDTRSPWATELTLLGVARPARYAGLLARPVTGRRDQNAVSVALASPDLYDDAVPDHVLGAAARALDDTPGTGWDLVFTPWLDMENALRRSREPLRGLLTGSPLSSFDALLLVTRDELQVGGLLTILDLGGIALRAADRGERSPLVLVTGRLAWNPEPFHAFVDAFFPGDLEAGWPELTRAMAAPEFAHARRSEKLVRLATVPGVYVPSLFEAGREGPPHPREPGIRGRIARRMLSRLDGDDGSGPGRAPAVVPLAEVTRERLAIEVQRDCGGSCRACRELTPHARPRLRTARAIAGDAAAGIAAGGWDELALVAPPGVRRSYLGEVVRTMAPILAERRVGLTLPALRPEDVESDMLSEVARLRRTHIMLVPEISAEIADWEPLLTALERIGAAGWRSVDIEFALGVLEDADVAREMLPRIFRQLTAAGRRSDGTRLSLSIGLRLLVPRAHSAYQWDPVPGLEEWNERLGYYRGRLQGPRVRLRWDDAGMVQLRSRLARGDRSLAPVIESAWRRGARFDARRDAFDVTPWSAAFAEAGIPFHQAEPARDPVAPLPWSHLDMGTSTEMLRALREQLRGRGFTSDCHLRGRPDVATRVAEAAADSGRGAGAESRVTIAERLPQAAVVPVHPAPSYRSRLRRGTAPASGPCKVRIAYTIEDSLRFLSHLDIVRLFDRMLRRASLPVDYSQGTAPHPRISFGPPRAVGMASWAEFVDVAFTGPFTEERQATLRAAVPGGMRILRVMPLYGPRPSLEADVNCGAYRVMVVVGGEPAPLLADAGPWDGLTRGALPAWLIDRAATFEHAREAHIRRVTPKKVQDVDLRASLIEYEWDADPPGELWLQLLVAHGGRRRARPSEVAAALLGLSPEEAGRLRIERTGLYSTEPSGTLRDPFGDRHDSAWTSYLPARSGARRNV